MRLLIPALSLALVAQTFTACNKQKSDDQRNPADRRSELTDQVQNTRSPEEVKAGWIASADTAKKAAQAVGSESTTARYAGNAALVEDSCLAHDAKFSAVDNPTVGAFQSYYYQCDAVPACKMLISKFKKGAVRSWPVVRSRDLYILTQLIDEAEVLTITEACGSAQTMASNLAKLGIPSIAQEFENKSDQAIDAMLAETSGSTMAADEESTEEDEAYVLLPETPRAISNFGRRWVKIYSDETESNLRTSLPAEECEGVFADFQNLLYTLESDTRKVATTIEDLKNKIMIDPSLRILGDDKNPYRNQFAESTSFELLEENTVVTRGYLGLRGDAKKVLAKAFIEVTDQSMDPNVETLLSDLELNKIYFSQSTGSSNESQNKIEKMRSDFLLVFDLSNYSIESVVTEYTDGKVAFSANGTIQWNPGQEILRKMQDSNGDSKVERIRKDPATNTCTISSK